jgi:hypothetical protein
MRVIQREISVGANATIENLLAGSAYEFANGPALVSAGVTAAATGLQITVQSGGNSVAEESPPLIKTAFPSLEDDMYYNWGALAGERMVIRCRNTTGGAVVVRVLVQIQDAPRR